MSEEFYEINGHKFRKTWPVNTCGSCFAFFGRCHDEGHRIKVLDCTVPNTMCDVMQIVKGASEFGLSLVAGIMEPLGIVKEGKE